MSTRLTDARFRILAMMVANKADDTDANASGATATLAEGSNADTFQLANITKFKINGVLKAKAATDNIAWLSWDTSNEPVIKLNPSAGLAEKCRMLVLINAAGTVTVRQSEVVLATADDPDYPAMPTNGLYATMGGINVETDDSTTFTFGATGADLTDEGDTVTYDQFTWPTSGPSHLNFLT